MGVAQVVLLALIPPPSRLGFSAVGCSNNNSKNNSDSRHCASFLGRSFAFRGKRDDYQWIDGSKPAASPAPAGATVEPSVCAMSPSLPTHEELLRHCAMEADVDALYVPENDFLE